MDEIPTDRVMVALTYLREQVDAQIRATDRQNDAFLRILDKLEYLNERGKRHEDSDSDHARDILRQVELIRSELNENHKRLYEVRDNINQKMAVYSDTVEGLFEDVAKRLSDGEELAPKMAELAQQFQEQKAAINEQKVAILNRFDVKNTADTVELKDLILQTRSSQAGVLELKATLEAMKTTIDAFHQSHQALNKKWQIARIAAVVVGVLWALAQAFVQLGLMNIQWFPHK